MKAPLEKLEVLHKVMKDFAGLSEEDIALSLANWNKRTIAKHDFYNQQNVVCKDLGIVVKGLFRVYYYDEVDDRERNIFFFSENQFIVSFGSFIAQNACYYYIEALEEAEILYISYDDLQQLYDRSKPWQKFGRLLAEHFFGQSQVRTHQLLFHNHEQRYLHLAKEHPSIVQRVPSFHIASFLGIKDQSLSRIKSRIAKKNKLN